MAAPFYVYYTKQSRFVKGAAGSLRQFPNLTKSAPSGRMKTRRTLLHKRRLAHLLRKEVVHFPEIVSKGGDACVGKTVVHGTPVSGMPGLLGLHTNHKSVLAARLRPVRLT